MFDKFMEFLMIADITDSSMQKKKNKEVCRSGVNSHGVAKEFVPPSNKIRVIDGTTYEVVQNADGKTWDVLKNGYMWIRKLPTKKNADGALQDL